MAAPGKPLGTSPILSFRDGRFIKQSIAIIEYFEDLSEAAADGIELDLTEEERETGRQAGPIMRRNAVKERAKTREILGLVCHLTCTQLDIRSLT